MTTQRLDPDPRLPQTGDMKLLVVRLFEYLKRAARILNGCADGYVSTTVSVTAAYTVQRGDVVILASAAGGAYAVTLQDPGEHLDKVVHIRKTEGSANNVTITPPSGQIDGAGTLALTAASPRARIASNGTNFFTV